MRWVLLVVSIVVGYMVSQILNMLFVMYWYMGKRDEFLLLPLVAFLFFLIVGFATGTMISLISREKYSLASYIVCVLITVVTVLNIIMDIAVEPLSHKLTVLFVLPPSIVLAAYLKGKTVRSEKNAQ